MGYIKPKETTRWHLENAPLPNHGKSYTVISHKQVIDNTMKLLNDSGFIIQKSFYRASTNASVAQGVYYIHPANTKNDLILNEGELGMMFAWTNSYDKSTRFQCAIGGYVKVSSNGLIAGDLLNYKRKHTGSADMDAKVQISNQIKNAEKYYERIIQDRNVMKDVRITRQQQSELIGRLFIDEKLLDSQQMSNIKTEMHKPTYQYDTNPETAWCFYNVISNALKKAHPREWLCDQQNFHDFMIALCLSNSYVTIEEKVEIIGENEFDNLVMGEDVEIIDDGTWINPQVSLSL